MVSISLEKSKIRFLLLEGVHQSAVDSLQYGYQTIVDRDAVGDRAQGPHEANLFDIDAKYGDVISLDEALDYLQSLGSQNRQFAAGGASR